MDAVSEYPNVKIKLYQLFLCRWMMTEEKELGLAPTVTLADIEECYGRYLFKIVSVTKLSGKDLRKIGVGLANTTARATNDEI